MVGSDTHINDRHGVGDCNLQCFEVRRTMLLVQWQQEDANLSFESMRHAQF